MTERLHRDEGQVLGLALAFLTFVALVLAATLTAATTNLHATQAAGQQRDERYAAEAGILAAAARIQADTTGALGTDRQTPGQCDFHSDSDFVNSMKVDVECKPQRGSGAGAGAPNRPDYSVLALTSAGPGSNEGVIEVNGANVDVYGRVGSNGACNVAQCPPPLPPGTAIPDPAYPPATAPPAPRAPSCEVSAAVFWPGTYNAPPSIDLCEKPWSFQPGVYYFDFSNSGSHVWIIYGTVVGGTPNEWDPMNPSSLPPSLPGACRTEDQLPPNAGVQFIFGGDSQLQVAASGRVELCAQPSRNRQQIAIYGLSPSFGTTSDPAASPQEIAPDSATSTGGAPYDNPPAATAIDGTDTQASIPANTAASLQFDFPALPAGIVEHAELRIVHHEDPGLASLGLDLRNGNTVEQSFAVDPVACPPTPPCSDGTQSVDVTSQFFGDANLASTSDLNAVFTAQATDGGPYASFVDGVVLDLRLSPPPNAYRALTGCTQVTEGLATDPQGPQQPCPVLSTVAGAGLYVQGTVYAPTGGLNVNGRPDDPVRFNGGIIARTVVFRPGNGGASNGLGVTAGGGFDRHVVLTARVNGNETIRVAVSVSFDDVGAHLDRLPPKITYNNWDIK
jgi:hypothetical protein